jgi:hypothetical protein
MHNLCVRAYNFVITCKMVMTYAIWFRFVFFLQAKSRKSVVEFTFCKGNNSFILWKWGMGQFFINLKKVMFSSNVEITLEFCKLLTTTTRQCGLCYVLPKRYIYRLKGPSRFSCTWSWRAMIKKYIFIFLISFLLP